MKSILKKCNSNITWSKLVLLTLCASLLAGTAGATLEITDFFSDYTSSEVTFRSDQDHQGKAVFELMDGANVVESQIVPFKAGAGEEVSKVILWQNKHQRDYFTAKVNIYNDTKLHDNKTYPVSYGTVDMPSFHVVDFSASNKGVQLLLRPFNPSVVDIKIELLDGNDIVYTKTREVIVELLKRLSEKGQTIIVVTHDMEVAKQTNRIITMRDGKIEGDEFIAQHLMVGQMRGKLPPDYRKYQDSR
ncbi:MAG: hypothetical protein OIN86_03165 [Candidatus Methanoperedens sp.]|nr:hypothetical protein [Candidatus Methanoperedens sp.]CAG0960639.1 Macrolide export ATP-binding/permease protein MacB [Methanosarcinales archaeon]